MSNKINDIMRSWGTGRNALLYGPPATGKTRLISDLFAALREPPPATRGIQMDPADEVSTFTRPPEKITIPLPAKVVWTTFHQSYGYEDFVLGLRPMTSKDGTQLKPWAGVFLDAALELNDPDSDFKSVVIFIDEINRGNAARIFGEFMTFLDFEYREQGNTPLPIPLRQLTFEDGVSEQIHRSGGQVTNIPEGFTFPKDVYVVATMNSVDRAAIPIDSALARRFDRIEMRPDLDVLISHWGLDDETLPVPNEGNWEKLTPFQTGVLLLDRINLAVASDLGSEFELGHGLLTPVVSTVKSDSGADEPVKDDAAWRTFAKTWDEVLFPQLEDRYSGRAEQLLELLHVDTPPTGKFAWTLRGSRGGLTKTRALAPVRVSELPLDVIERSFRWLTH